MNLLYVVLGINLVWVFLTIKNKHERSWLASIHFLLLIQFNNSNNFLFLQHKIFMSDLLLMFILLAKLLFGPFKLNIAQCCVSYFRMVALSYKCFARSRKSFARSRRQCNSEVHMLLVRLWAVLSSRSCTKLQKNKQLVMCWAECCYT